MGNFTHFVNIFVSCDVLRVIFPRVAASRKKKSKLPKRELDICARFKQMRIDAGFSQREFARFLDYKRERLASYETGRAPLVNHVATLACLNLKVNVEWLATGKGPKHSPEELKFGYAIESDGNCLFSTAYDNYYSRVLALDSALEGSAEHSAEHRAAMARKSRDLAKWLMEYWNLIIKDEDWEAFVGLLWKLTGDFRSNKGKLLLWASSGKPKGNLLDEIEKILKRADPSAN